MKYCGKLKAQTYQILRHRETLRALRRQILRDAESAYISELQDTEGHCERPENKYCETEGRHVRYCDTERHCKRTEDEYFETAGATTDQILRDSERHCWAL